MKAILPPTNELGLPIVRAAERVITVQPRAEKDSVVLFGSPQGTFSIALVEVSDARC